MKGKNLKYVAIVIILLALAVPVSAKTGTGVSGPSADVVIDQVTPNLVDWYEDWDSYPTGQNMHGVGGWKGWYNDPGATAYTTDVEFISVPNSIDINGGSDLVHEYAVDSGLWTYTAYQYIPTGFADETYFILLNQYDDGGVTTNWSTQVRFDGNDGLAVFQGYYNDLAQLPLITGEWVELRVEIDLEGDWQQFFYDGDLLYEASWSNGIGAPDPGITSIGAVDLFANSSATVYYDNLSLVEAGAELPMFAKIKVDARDIPDGYVAAGIVRVVDELHTPLEGAEVTAFLKNPDGSTSLETDYTNANGRVKFMMASPYGGPWLFCIDSVQLAGYEWVPGPRCGFIWYPGDPP